MTPRHRMLLTVLALLAGAAAVSLVSWAADSGPVAIPVPSIAQAPPPAQPTPTPDQASSPSASARPDKDKSADHVPPPPHHLYWGLWLVGGLLAAGALWLLVQVAPRLARAWRERDDVRRRPGTTDVVPLPGVDAVARALVEQRQELLGVVDAGSPRNGIVAAWQRLEETTARSGVPRRRWETSSEFTTRILAGLTLDPDATATLAGLYRLARFSSHEIDENQRAAARSALDVLHDGLARERTP